MKEVFTFEILNESTKYVHNVNFAVCLFYFCSREF